MSEEIIRELAILKTRHEERWNQHDESAKELKDDMRAGFDSLDEKIGQIFSKLSKLPCDVMEEKIKGIGHRMAWIWGILVPIFLAIVGIALRVVFLK